MVPFLYRQFFLANILSERADPQRYAGPHPGAPGGEAGRTAPPTASQLTAQLCPGSVLRAPFSLNFGRWSKNSAALILKYNVPSLRFT